MIETIRITCRGATTLPLEKLIPFQGELKSLSEENYKKLKREILELGFCEPVSAWATDGGHFILNGHQRVRSLLKMQAEGFVVPELPVNLIEAATEKEAKLKVLALTSQYGQIERQGLYEFMTSAELDMSDIENFRFPEIDLADFNMEYFEDPTMVPQAEEDDAPAAPVTPVTRPGDIYQLGRHRLMCGSATILSDVDALMAGEKADMIFTDPPYNVNYEGKTKEALTIQNDKMEDDTFYKFLLDAHTSMFMVTKPGAAIYVAHADSEGSNFRRSMVDSGFLFKQCIIWVKNSLVMGRQDYHWQHEPILYGWAAGASHHWYGDRKQTTLWSVDRPQRNTEHPTMKPIALIEKALMNSSERSNLVIDFFGGSGSTLIACEKNHRRCNTMELDPRYCDVIVSRWEKFTGKKAVVLSREGEVVEEDGAV